MKKTPISAAIATVAAMAALLSGCAAKGRFLADGDPACSALVMYRFDGSECTSRLLFSQEQERKLLYEINSLPAKQTQAGELSGDIYAFGIGTGNGYVSGLWQDGVWITQDGTQYAVKADFGALTEGLEWDESNSVPLSALPNIRYLALRDGKWDTAYLEKAKEPKSSSLTLTVTNIADGIISADITNTSDEEQAFGLAFSVEACIDGEWYGIPPANDLCFNEIAMLVPAGKSAEQTYDFAGGYGELPEGLYRICTDFGSAEFEI